MTGSGKPYVAGAVAYAYPGLGEARPPGGAKVLLLTRGQVCVSGNWTDDGRFLAWSPMPNREDYIAPDIEGGIRAPSGDLLLLSKGGICIFGPWAADGRYSGWAPMPARDRSKEDALAARPRRD